MTTPLEHTYLLCGHAGARGRMDFSILREDRPDWCPLERVPSGEGEPTEGTGTNTC